MDRKTIAFLFVLLFASTANAQWYNEGGQPVTVLQPGQTAYHALLTTTATSVIDLRQCGRWSSIQKNEDTSLTVAIQRCFTTTPASCAADTEIGDLSATAYDYAYLFGAFFRAVPTSGTVDQARVTCVGGEL